mgnify:CR=1 FL=1
MRAPEDDAVRPALEDRHEALGDQLHQPEELAVAKAFELRLLAFTGFMPELYDCADCGTTLQPQEHVFSAQRGGGAGFGGPACWEPVFPTVRESEFRNIE